MKLLKKGDFPFKVKSTLNLRTQTFMLDLWFTFFRLIEVACVCVCFIFSEITLHIYCLETYISY